MIRRNHDLHYLFDSALGWFWLEEFVFVLFAALSFSRAAFLAARLASRTRARSISRGVNVVSFSETTFGFGELSLRLGPPVIESGIFAIHFS